MKDTIPYALQEALQGYDEGTKVKPAKEGSAGTHRAANT